MYVAYGLVFFRDLIYVSNTKLFDSPTKMKNLNSLMNFLHVIMDKIILAKRFQIPNPEERIREYLRVEIFRGYDDKHAIDNIISQKDIRAANQLFARIGQETAKRLQTSSQLQNILSEVKNEGIGELSPNKWIIVKNQMNSLLKTACAINGVGLAVATKILHLKRPKLIPILDSFVIKLLTGHNITSANKLSLPQIGVDTMEIIREDLIEYHEEFDNLSEIFYEPIPLEKIRIYDILAWSTEKWDIQGNTMAPYGKATT